MKNLFFLIVSFSLVSLFVSCSDDDSPSLQSSEITYELHNGQTIPSLPYGGFHNSDFSATMSLEEMSNGNTMITITLNNTIDGQTYHIHAHDAADAATTPNGTPYNEMPNSDIFAMPVDGNGGSVSVSQEATMAYADLTTTYEGFFVVHDPLQEISTTDITSYLVVGSFARAQTATGYQSSTFSYDFNTGQVAEAFAYAGMHADNLSAEIQVDELAENKSRVVVRIMNTLDGEMYHTHAHDMADPATTPNGTPYDEMPNADVFAAPIMGNGGTSGAATISTKTYGDIISTYDGFFVVHDPLQALSTTDPTTYVLLGVFAR